MGFQTRPSVVAGHVAAVVLERPLHVIEAHEDGAEGLGLREDFPLNI
jgi:hypothetical protein